MASIPFALSVHHFISSVGADAGFASLIGLALLILLYFAHARETATLRSRADEAGLRVQELESQLADLADQVAALPAEISVRATGPRVALAHDGIQQHAVAGVGASGGSQVPFPGAPAGVGAPALASATRMIPMPDPRTVQPEPAPAAATVAGATNGSGRIPVAAGAGTVQRPAQTPAGAPPRPPAGPGRGVGGPGRAGGPITGQPRPVGAGQRPITGQPRTGGPSNARRPGGPGGPSYVPVRAERRLSLGRVVLAVAVVALGAAAIVAAVLVLTHKDAAKAPGQSTVSSSLTSRRSKATSTVVRPATVTVSVLNGTDLTGLAGRVAGKLTAAGFQKGAVTDATNQTETTSTVAYLVPADRADALAVAAALKLKASSVQRVDPNTKSVACSFAPVGCSSPVYVTVGSDLSSQ
jgi:LytR cell envelope-related transcriptional attenuator